MQQRLIFQSSGFFFQEKKIYQQDYFLNCSVYLLNTFSVEIMFDLKRNKNFSVTKTCRTESSLLKIAKICLVAHLL